MTNDNGSKNGLSEDVEHITPKAWQDYIRRKIKPHSSWLRQEDPKQEKGTSESGNKQFKGLTKNLFLEDFEDSDVGRTVVAGKNDTFNVRGKASGADQNSAVFSGDNDNINDCDAKKKIKKGLRVSFKERVHLISPDIRKPPTTQRLKSGDEGKTRINSSLPLLEKSSELPNPENLSKRKGRSTSAKAKYSDFDVYVDGTSMSRGRSLSLKGLQRFLPQVPLGQGNDFDSAVIEIVREYNDPCRGVYGESIDLYI